MLICLEIITTFKLGISLGIGFCHQKQDNIVWKIFIVAMEWAFENNIIILCVCAGGGAK